MAKIIENNSVEISKEYKLPRSKSISNRLLILAALYDFDLDIDALSESTDTQVMKEILSNTGEVWDVGDAGTAMRFLLALAVAKKENVTLTGSKRMQERPIGPLVDALRELGADIEYLGAAGFPPLKVTAAVLEYKTWNVQGDISSQFVSALAMILPYFQESNMLKIHSNPVSLPYVDMTLKLMQQIGLDIKREGHQIIYRNSEVDKTQKFEIESDYSALAFPVLELSAGGGEMFIRELTKPSGIQGDEAVLDFLEPLGIHSKWEHEGLRMVKQNTDRVVMYEQCIDFGPIPDLALPITLAMTTKYDLFYIRGIENLNYKESARWEVCKDLLLALGYEVKLVDGEFRIQQVAVRQKVLDLPDHSDHRVVMCMASLHPLFKKIIIENPEAVAKSWPKYWEYFTENNECS